jgi:hypothetical protein
MNKKKHATLIVEHLLKEGDTRINIGGIFRTEKSQTQMFGLCKKLTLQCAFSTLEGLKYQLFFNIFHSCSSIFINKSDEIHSTCFN